MSELDPRERMAMESSARQLLDFLTRGGTVNEELKRQLIKQLTKKEQLSIPPLPEVETEPLPELVMDGFEVDKVIVHLPSNENAGRDRYRNPTEGASQTAIKFLNEYLRIREPEKSNEINYFGTRVEYEPATWDEKTRVVTIGDEAFSDCKKLDVPGAVSKVFSTKRQDGTPVIIKFSQKSIFEKTKKSMKGDGLKLMKPQREEGDAVLTVITREEQAQAKLSLAQQNGQITTEQSRVKPEQLAVGTLPTGEILTVSEFIPKVNDQFLGEMTPRFSNGKFHTANKDFLEFCIEHNGHGDPKDLWFEEMLDGKRTGTPTMEFKPDEFFQDPKKSEAVKENIKLDQAIKLLKLRDHLTLMGMMKAAGVYNQDFKKGDFLIDNRSFEKGISVPEVDGQWRGIQVDLGMDKIRLDGKSWSDEDYKKLFVVILRIFADTTLPKKPFYNEKELDPVIKAKFGEEFGEWYKITDQFKQLIETEINSPQDDFVDQFKVTLDKLNTIMGQLGMQKRLPNPFV